jgi:hypothetical protein
MREEHEVASKEEDAPHGATTLNLEVDAIII